MNPDQNTEPTGLPSSDQNIVPIGTTYQPTVIKPQPDSGGTLLVSHDDRLPTPVATAAPTLPTPQADVSPVVAPPQAVQTPVGQPVLSQTVYEPAVGQTPTQPTFAQPQPATMQPVAPQSLDGFGQPIQPEFGQSVPPAQPLGGQPLTPSGPTPPMGGQAYPPSSAPQPPKKTSKKKLIIGGIILALLLVLLGGGYVFAIYIPNQPQNVWKTGLERSGKAVDAIVNQGTEKQNLDAYKKSEVNLSVTASGDQLNFSGQLNIKFDSANAAADLKVVSGTAGEADKAFTAKILSQLKAGSQYPNLYVQFAGLKALGFDAFLPDLVKYDSKWISIDESYLKSIGIKTQDVKNSNDKQLTANDVTEAVKAISSVTQEYLFTSRPDKALLDQRQFVGKEKVDGKSVYHYIVAINKQHAKDYCSAVVDKLVNTQVYKKYSSGDTNAAKDSLTKDCQQSVDDNIKDTNTFGMWIDAKYKLIYKIRVTDDKDPKIYLDLGQNYSGGDDVSFFLNYHNGSDKTDSKLNLATNLKTHASKGTMNLTGSGTSPYEYKVTLDGKPYTGEIKSEAPAGAVPIQDVLKALGLDSLLQP